MTGPEHYREAEKRVTAARSETDPQWALIQVQLAIAEATLALAAATALPQNRMLALAEYKAWARVAAEKLPEGS